MGNETINMITMTCVGTSTCNLSRSFNRPPIENFAMDKDSPLKFRQSFNVYLVSTSQFSQLPVRPFCVDFSATNVRGRFAADKCSGVKPALRCYNRGYRDPNDCSKCKCPEGFGKRQCRDPAPANGGMLSDYL